MRLLGNPLFSNLTFKKHLKWKIINYYFLRKTAQGILLLLVSNNFILGCS